jgi:hypothetical protein
MMAKDEIILNGREFLQSIRLRVRMPRMLGLRMWMATRLFQLAGFVSGTTVVIEIDDDEWPVEFADAGLRGEPANPPWDRTWSGG